jgi:hypothetical protein
MKHKALSAVRSPRRWDTEPITDPFSPVYHPFRFSSEELTLTDLGALLFIVFIVAVMAGSVRWIVAVLLVGLLLASPFAFLALVGVGGLLAYVTLKH